MGLLNYIKNVFSTDCCQEEEEGELIATQSIQRSDDYCIRYGKWTKQKQQQAILSSIHQASQKKGGCPSKKDKSICFVQIPTMNGFTMFLDRKRWDEEDFKYLFEYLSVVLKQKFGYTLKKSIEERIKYSNRTETVERYSFKNDSSQASYSKVLLRLCYTNSQITSFKFCATSLPGQQTNITTFLEKVLAV